MFMFWLTFQLLVNLLYILKKNWLENLDTFLNLNFTDLTSRDIQNSFRCFAYHYSMKFFMYFLKYL